MPGGAAEPPATGKDEQLAAEVRKLVRRFPWAAWAKQARRRFELREVDADDVQTAICDAMTNAGLTLDQAAVIGPVALAEAKGNPVSYVAGAFRPPQLARRVRALCTEPLSSDPLPLPIMFAAPEVEQVSVDVGSGEALASGTPRAKLGPCDTCKSPDDGPVAPRVVLHDNGSMPCPDCRPADHAAWRARTAG